MAAPPRRHWHVALHRIMLHRQFLPRPALNTCAPLPFGTKPKRCSTANEASLSAATVAVSAGDRHAAKAHSVSRRAASMPNPWPQKARPSQ